MITDLLGGILCLLIAFSIFVLEIVTSAKRWAWVTLPTHVRAGLFATGASVLYRGVNFLNIAGHRSVSLIGHLNAEGLIASACMAYTMSALAVFVVSRSPAVQAWALRLKLGAQRRARI